MDTLVIGTALFICASTANAEIYQWYDGDGDGSLWLSNAVVEPYANVREQVLWWAELPFANLHHANLVFANLSYANLWDANLSAADLSYSNLYAANLGSADLAFANFYGANLRSSNIDDANMFYADFSNADLSDMQKWETAFWMAAKYNNNTIFPEGMNPNTFGMIFIEVPTPGIACMFGVAFVLQRRRR